MIRWSPPTGSGTFGSTGMSGGSVNFFLSPTCPNKSESSCKVFNSLSFDGIDAFWFGSAVSANSDASDRCAPFLAFVSLFIWTNVIPPDTVDSGHCIVVRIRPFTWTPPLVNLKLGIKFLISKFTNLEIEELVLDFSGFTDRRSFLHFLRIWFWFWVSVVKFFETCTSRDQKSLDPH